MRYESVEAFVDPETGCRLNIGHVEVESHREIKEGFLIKSSGSEIVLI